MMIRIRNLALATLLVAGLAACGSSSSGATSGGGSGPSAGGGTPVTIQGFAFHPSALTVKAGTKITFTNEDSAPHTATSQGNSTIDSGDLSKGQTYTVTMTTPGTYHYICTIHQYMTGTIIVK